MNAILKVREAGVPCTLTAASFADAVYEDRTGGVVMAAIQVGCGGELGNVQPSIKGGIVGVLRWCGQPGTQSFLHEDFIFRVCLHNGAFWSPQCEDAPELSAEELALVRRCGSMVRFAYPYALKFLKDGLKQHAMRPPFLGFMASYFQIRNRSPTLREISDMLIDLSRSRFPQWVSDLFQPLVRYKEWARRKIFWLKSWHRAEAERLSREDSTHTHRNSFELVDQGASKNMKTELNRHDPTAVTSRDPN